MYYNNRNRSNLNQLANNTKKEALKWYEYCVENGINILVYETIRTAATQQKYFNSGASKTLNSYHLVGQALDFVPVNAKGECLWGGYGDKNVKKAIAYAKSLGFIWGGDAWPTFIDKPHLQYNYKGYGSDTFGGIVEAPKTQVKSEVVVNVPVNENKIATFQDWLNDNYKTGIKEDGLYGPKTKRAALKALQTELNKQYKVGLVVDGIWGPKTKGAIRTVSRGTKGAIPRIVQGMLYCHKQDPKGFDGIFGDNSFYAVKKFQGANNLTVDGLCGRNTFEKMFK